MTVCKTTNEKGNVRKTLAYKAEAKPTLAVETRPPSIVPWEPGRYPSRSGREGKPLSAGAWALWLGEVVVTAPTACMMASPGILSKGTQLLSSCRSRRSSREACLDRERWGTDAVALQALPFSYQRRLSLSPSVPEKQHWELLGGPSAYTRAQPQSPRDFCTICLAILQNCSRSSRHILEASTLAPLSSLGSASMLTTDRRIFSTLCTGLHRSALLS